MHAATLILVPILAVVLLFASLWGGRMIRAWQQSREGGRVAHEDRDRLALEDEKQRLLIALGDLDHEHLLGKISDEDHAGLKRFYEREAVRVMKALEAR